MIVYNVRVENTHLDKPYHANKWPACQEVNDQSKAILGQSSLLATFFFSNIESGISSEVSWVLIIDFVEICTVVVWIQPFSNYNINNTPTLKFFPLQVWNSHSPSVFLLKSLTMRKFMLQVYFFPLFRIRSTTSGLSSSHVDPNDIWEFISNWSNDLFLLLIQYCRCTVPFWTQ